MGIKTSELTEATEVNDTDMIPIARGIVSRKIKAGLLKILKATLAEALAGTDESKYMTPKTVKEAIDNNATIVDSGSNTNGSWIKYSNGDMICKNAQAFSNMAITTAQGNIYTSGTRNDLNNFPQAFIGVPTIVKSCLGGWFGSSGSPSATSPRFIRDL